MKKITAALLVCALAGMTVLGGCGSEETADADEADSAEETAQAEETGEEVYSTEEILSATGYDAFDYVTLPDDYMGMTLELTSSYVVTEEDVREYLDDEILAYYPAYTVADKAIVEDGDIVNIDFVGTLDGEEFEGGSAEGYELTIGSQSFIDGFEDGLIGQEVGTTVDLDLTFPEDYSAEDLAGQDVVFTVTINSIVEETILTYDDLTDEYVEETFSSYGIATTVDELINYVEEALQDDYDYYKRSEIQDLALEFLEENSVVDCPQEMLDEAFNLYIDGVKVSAAVYDMDYEEYALGATGYSDIESFETYVMDTLRDNLTQDLIMEAVIKDLQVTITRSEFDSYVATRVAYYGSYYGFENAEEFYDYCGGEDYAILSCAENRALSLVEDAAVIVLVDGTTETGAEAMGTAAEEEADE